MIYRLISFCILFALTLFSSVPSLAEAVATTSTSTTFTVSVTIAADTATPTAPTALVATAVNDTQIDLSWTASTDNVGIAGYHIFRDGVLVATSTGTGTTFSDTGLTANTSYVYAVRAFDAANNVSDLSTSASATTQDNASGGGSSSGSSSGRGNRDIVIDPFSLAPSSDSAVVTLSTSEPTTVEILLGSSPATVGLYQTERVLREDHNITLDDLLPDTQYFFEVNVFDEGGDTESLSGSFSTPPIIAPAAAVPVQTPIDQTNPIIDLVNNGIPADVSRFTAFVNGEEVFLQWENPDDLNFDRVRVVANPNGFPQNSTDGVLLYEGVAETLSYFVPGEFDSSSISEGRIFHAAFGISDEGVVSGGVVALATLADDVPDKNVDTDQLFGEGVVGIEPNIQDVIFLQNNEVINVRTTAINGDVPALARIPATAIPSNRSVSTIVITDANNPSVTYIFKLEPSVVAATMYEAAISSLQEPGQYPYTVTLYDEDGLPAGQIAGIFTVFVSDTNGLKFCGFDFGNFGLSEYIRFVDCNLWWLWIPATAAFLVGHRLFTGMWILMGTRKRKNIFSWGEVE